MGIINAVSSTGQVSGVFICGIAVSLAGHEAPFYIAVGAGLIAPTLSFFINEPKISKPNLSYLRI